MFYQDFLSSFQPPHLAVAFHAGRVGMGISEPWKKHKNEGCLLLDCNAQTIGRHSRVCALPAKICCWRLRCQWSKMGFSSVSQKVPQLSLVKKHLSLFYYKYKKRKDYRTIDNVTLVIHHVGWIRIPSIQIWIHMNPFVTQESWHPALYSLLQLRIPTVITGYSLAEQIGGRGL